MNRMRALLTRLAIVFGFFALCAVLGVIAELAFG